MAVANDGGGISLPADLYHLLAQELADRQDFATLFNLVVSSKQLASSGAVDALYRYALTPIVSITHLTPAHRISHEFTSVVSSIEAFSFAEQDVAVMRWSILWRTITRSSLGKTMFPYCRHLRRLDLRDLGLLLDQLDEPKYRGKVTKQFFAGDLSRFHHVFNKTQNRRAGRSDIKKIVTSIGDAIIQKSPLLEGLSEPITLDILAGALPSWAPQLRHLRELELWDSKALADEKLRDLLRIHCSKLERLRIHHSSDSESDHHLASFISSMPPNTLTLFENISTSGIGAETCLALNHHRESLLQLKLAMAEDGILALALLQGCSNLETLAVSSLVASVDLKATQNDTYLEIVEWLKSCRALQELSFTNLVSAPDLMLPILLNQATKLQKLQINSGDSSTYVVKDHHDFHRALAEQSSLKSLYLRADPEPVSRDDIDVLINTFCSLTDLRELNLIRISDYFTDRHIQALAEHLSHLEELYITGYGISDAALDSLSNLENLRNLNLSGISTFTKDGLLSFISKLGPGNQGLSMSVDMADPQTMLSQEEQDTVRDALINNAEGRFEYQPVRDPGVPEFDQSDSD